MDSENSSLEKPVRLDKESPVAEGTVEERATNIAFNALCESQFYKQGRMDKIRLFERMYYNDIPPRFRQIHNCIMPIFGGLVDKVLADLNDEVQLKFSESKPSDYLTIPKVQAHWENERDSLEPTAMWNYKARADRFNAVLSGRRIMQNYAESDPEYKNVLEVINYTDFHSQPLGGGILENHLWCGREGIYRTLEDIYTDENYPKEQRDKLKNFSYSNEWWMNIETTYGTRLQRFWSNRLDPESNSYTGDKTVNLARFGITMDGARYMVLFEPLTKIWLDVQLWNHKWPWYSAATHEDHKLFWSKAYADDFYHVAENVIMLVQQEITNREKVNNQSRAVDPRMFPDLARLDSAQYETGRIVPFNSMPDGVNVRRAADGIYDFTVQGLTGSIQLSTELIDMLEKYTSATDIPVPAGAKPSVMVSIQQQNAKRIGLRTDGMKEMDAQIGLSFFEGLKEHMPARVSVRMLGENGFISESELTRMEVNQMGAPICKVVSTSEQESQDSMKRDGRIKAITMLTENQNLNSFEKEMILRDIGQFDEAQITFAVENMPYSARKQVAHASQDLQALFAGKEPETYYGADGTYQKYFYEWIIDHKSQLSTKFPRFFEYLKKMQPIFEANAKMQGQKANSQMQQQKAAAGAQGGGGAPAPKTTTGKKPAATPAAKAAQPSPFAAVAKGMGSLMGK